MVVLSHFKGHLLSGFGGAIKNLGMGCASRGGKLYQHSSVKPRLREKKCIACGVCAEHCPANAITVTEVAQVDEGRCIGCGECLQRCPTGAYSVSWDQEKVTFMRRMAAYAAAATKVTRTALCVNFIVRVAPDCDCMRDTGAFLVEDLGVVASTDPVALDAASQDLVTAAAPPPSSPVASKAPAGQDKFRAHHPSTDGKKALEEAARFEIGCLDYRLHEV